MILSDRAWLVEFRELRLSEPIRIKLYARKYEPLSEHQLQSLRADAAAGYIELLDVVEIDTPEAERVYRGMRS